MQFGERSLRFVSLLGALLLLTIGIGFVLAMERSRDIQTASYASGALKIHVDEDGLYRISLVDLWDAKSLANAESGAALNLTTRGVQVPYFIDSDGLYFYGAAPTSRYLSYKP
ncbi:MAG: hypothetical protein ACK2T3_00555, partial [Candidatus Promineifilaceae bacterium]